MLIQIEKNTYEETFSVLTSSNGVSWREVYVGDEENAVKIAAAFEHLGYDRKDEEEVTSISYRVKFERLS